MSKRIDGFLVFPQQTESATNVRIGVFILPNRVKELFSLKCVESMEEVFTKKSNTHVDSTKGVVSRMVLSGMLSEEVQRFRDELKKVGICVTQTQLPRQKDVDLVLAA